MPARGGETTTDRVFSVRLRPSSERRSETLSSRPATLVLPACSIQTNASEKRRAGASPYRKTPSPRFASQSAAASPTRRRKNFSVRKKVVAGPFPRARRRMQSARQKHVFPEKHSLCHHMFYEHVISHSIHMPGSLLLTHTVTLHPPCGAKVSASVVLLCPDCSSTEIFQNVKTKNTIASQLIYFFHNLIFPCVPIFFHDIVGCLHPLVPKGYSAQNRSGLPEQFGPRSAPETVSAHARRPSGGRKSEKRNARQQNKHARQTERRLLRLFRRRAR